MSRKKNKENKINKEKKTFKQKMTIVLMILSGLLFLSVIVCLMYVIEKKEYKKEQREFIPGIVCIGDSLTAGTDGSYPAFLREILAKKHVITEVINLGVGGENSLTIAGRMGAIPFRVDSFVIPASPEKVEVELIQPCKESVNPLTWDVKDGINPCCICGVEGILSAENTEKGRTYYFERTSEGEETAVNEGEKVETYANTAYNNYIYILFMGENGGFTDTENLIEQQQAIIDTQTQDDRFLIIGLTSGTAEERAEMESMMEAAWGENYINLREYFTDIKFLNNYDIFLSESDMADIDEGRVPMCLRSDDIHYNEKGYEILADIVYTRMKKLGYLADALESADSFYKKWGWVDNLF